MKTMEITYLILRALINSGLPIYFVDIRRYKYIRAERGAFSIIDYIIANQKMINIVLDTRVFRGSDGVKKMVQALELDNEKTEQGRSIQCTPYEEDSLKDMYQRII